VAPNRDMIDAFVDGRLSADDHDLMVHHISSCTECAGAVIAVLAEAARALAADSVDRAVNLSGEQVPLFDDSPEAEPVRDLLQLDLILDRAGDNSAELLLRPEQVRELSLAQLGEHPGVDETRFRRTNGDLPALESSAESPIHGRPPDARSATASAPEPALQEPLEVEVFAQVSRELDAGDAEDESVAFAAAQIETVEPAAAGVEAPDVEPLDAEAAELEPLEEQPAYAEPVVAEAANTEAVVVEAAVTEAVVVEAADTEPFVAEASDAHALGAEAAGAGVVETKVTGPEAVEAEAAAAEFAAFEASELEVVAVEATGVHARDFVSDDRIPEDERAAIVEAVRVHDGEPTIRGRRWSLLAAAALSIVAFGALASFAAVQLRDFATLNDVKPRLAQAMSTPATVTPSLAHDTTSPASVLAALLDSAAVATVLHVEEGAVSGPGIDAADSATVTASTPGGGAEDAPSVARAAPAVATTPASANPPGLRRTVGVIERADQPEFQPPHAAGAARAPAPRAAGQAAAADTARSTASDSADGQNALPRLLRTTTHRARADVDYVLREYEAAGPDPAPRPGINEFRWKNTAGTRLFVLSGPGTVAELRAYARWLRGL
jgi:hypothetical protein